MKYLFSLLITFTIFNLCAQQTPAPEQSQPISIVGVTAHIGNGEVVENAIIVFENGKITQVSDVNKAQPKGKVIQAEGKHVYPGFIAPNSTLGLAEIDAVRATRDEDEIGTFLPHIRSVIAYNAESKIVESMRPNGVLMGQITPRGGRISGTSSIVQFDAWNWEDAIVKADDGIHMNWPRSFSRSGNWYDTDRRYEINKNYTKQLDELHTFFDKSKAYYQSDDFNRNTVYEAMKGLFNGEKTLFVHVDAEKEVLDLLAFKAEYNLENVVIVGGAEAHRVANEINAANVPVLLQRVHSTPNFEGDDYDLPYKLPKLLSDKGILVGLESSGQMERMNTRNLPFYAGTAVAYGLDKKEALKMITLNTAKILGIDDFAGSLEIGKDATLFISEGDALDMQGNRLTHAFIQGGEISLESHQTELYKRYSNKYNHKIDE
ncbi:amidohydrolase family protein [Mesohalobacter halotolerans]|uniref:Amidohydrolase n=1 Tax=Mesohalobacter halotolerans TaxID=1883405 RepID=A0A4U5TRP6_9FLAO|nr:amidohydrolase family protein [Mesohalobacter halotolerans]TKS55998.1 amidohydrolase [Mesohalobacter halotolerans]